MSEKKEKSTVENGYVFDVGKSLLLIISTMIPISTASVALSASFITMIGYIVVGVMIFSLFLALIFCVEGLFKKDKRLVEISRYFVYISLFLLAIFYISVAYNLTQSGMQIALPRMPVNISS